MEFVSEHNRDISLEVTEGFDKEGDLSFEIYGSDGTDIFLRREQVIELRDHLTELLGD